MALDKNDLKQIRDIVREEVHDQIEAEVPQIVRDQIRAEVPQIINDQVSAEVPPIVEAKIFPIGQKVEQIWNALDEDLISNITLIEKLSKRVKELEARVKKLEMAR